MREFNSEVEVEISKSTDNGMPKSTQAIEPTVEFHVNVDRVSAVTMIVPMLIQGKKLKAVVDTGAEVTILSERVYNSLPDKCKLPLEQAKTKLVVAEADKSMRTEGVVNPKFIIGDKEVEWPMYVTPILDDILLGCDFLDMKDITVSTKRGLEMEGKWIDCIIERKHTLARVCIKRSLKVPANSEFVVSSKVDDMNLVGTRYGMMEPTLEDSRGIIVARSLIDTQNKEAIVRIVNPSTRPIRMKKHQLIGELHPVKYLSDVDIFEEKHDLNDLAGICRISEHKQDLKMGLSENKCLQISKQKVLETETPIMPTSFLQDHIKTEKKILTITEELPSYLKDLYERGCQSIYHKNKFAQVLNKHKDTFAKNKTDLGSYCGIKHKINTACAAPVRQPLRRTPQAFENEEESYLKDQLEAGVIVPSNSAWASAVVLVRKKNNSVRWCVDYRRLNDRTIKEAYPLPRVDMCLDCPGSAKIFSTLDLQSGYWQIKMDEKDQAKTAFITKYKLVCRL